MMAIQAFGKIAAYQATLGTCLVLTLPLAWIFLKLGAPPTSVGFAFVITMIAISAGRVLWMRRLLGEPVSRWIKDVILPCMIVSGVTVTAVLVPRLSMSASFVRLICVSVTSLLVSLLSTWFLALDKREREFVRRSQKSLLSKIGRIAQRSK